MTVTPLKASMVALGVSGASLSGYGIYRFTSSKETIKDRITASLTDKKKRFFGKGDSKWGELSSKYDSLKNKPKKADGTSELSFQELPEGCDKSASEEYSDSKKNLYDQVLTFCFFNTNTLLSNIDSGELKSSEAEGHEDWQNAGDLYNKDTNKVANKLNITDGSVNTNINGSDKVEGGKAMHKGCNATATKKMYDSEDLFPIFKRGCVK